MWIPKQEKMVPEKLQPISWMLWETFCKELLAALDLGVVGESPSEWRNPIVLVLKLNGSTHFSMDFWKINALLKFDPYPMSRLEELLERSVATKYISPLSGQEWDWQIPLI